MFCTGVSAEKINSTEINNLPSLTILEKNEDTLSSGRVDINILLGRARKAKEKETLTNLVFIVLTLFLFFIVGIILSF